MNTSIPVVTLSPDETSFPYSLPSSLFSQSLSMKLHTMLSADLSTLVNNPEDADVMIKCGKEQVRIWGHSLILKTRSSFFKEALTEEYLLSEDLCTVVEIGMEKEIVELLVGYLYTGTIIKPLSQNIVLPLLVAAKCLSIDELIDPFQTLLTTNYQQWSKSNFVSVLSCVHLHPEFEILSQYADELLRTRPELLFKSEKFTTLEENVLLDILQRGIANTRQTELWDSVLKFSIANTPEIQYLVISKSIYDTSQWSPYHFKCLKRTLDKFVEFVNFQAIPPAEFKKVHPFLFILPQHVSREIIKLKIDSTTMSQKQADWVAERILSGRRSQRPKHVEVVREGMRSDWQCKEGNDANDDEIHNLGVTDGIGDINSIGTPPPPPPPPLTTVSYKKSVMKKLSFRNGPSSFPSPSPTSTVFPSIRPASPKGSRVHFRLLVRGSRDGFTPSVFHQRCDNKGPTITVVRVRGTNEVIGGYNPLSWRKADYRVGCFHSSDKAFIFNFNDWNARGEKKRTFGDDATVDRLHPIYEYSIPPSHNLPPSPLFHPQLPPTPTSSSPSPPPSLNTTIISLPIISYPVVPNNAIVCNSLMGPHFGYSDLSLQENFRYDNRCYCVRSSYDKAIRDDDGFFSVDEYEVFQVVWED
ncbi:654_t:CDS:2 [Paraglomus occultum]|uniref:654_t:CDS:1 n=1 Tax=Paraglomus occultum TaxID=144539 RepID=A0A9N8Z2F4_9GLOM|nr:654_t:CDS:2 [Paraglomus occultum]